MCCHARRNAACTCPLASASLGAGGEDPGFKAVKLMKRSGTGTGGGGVEARERGMGSG